MRRNSIALVNGLLTLKDETVGPRHDPYGRQTVELWRDGLVWSLVACGLAGEWIETPALGEIKLVEPMFDQTDRIRLRQEWEAKVIEITGMPSYYWHHKVWAKRDQARWRRMTPEERWQDEMIREADDALYRYAMG